MDPVLDRIEAALVETEDQLVDEFNRARKANPEDGVARIDIGIKSALDSVAMELWHNLEHSGDKVNLSLKTERHEMLESRIITVKKLLEAIVSVDLLIEVQMQRQQDSAAMLAVVARRFRAAGDEKDLMNAVAAGRAQFRTRELSAAAVAALDKAKTPEELRQKLGESGRGTGSSSFASRELSQTTAAPPKQGIARTPEEIRRKLAEKSGASSGASRFEAKDLSGGLPPSPPPPPRQKIQTEKREIAQSPEEIRKKLAARQAQTGQRASFAARDIEPAAPPPVPQRKPESRKPEPARPKEEDKPASGRAIFESKDLSTPPTRK